jgi:hypothetical protein
VAVELESGAKPPQPSARVQPMPGST